jgi:pimeloyl-ACP methyl ester carboxylesterase
MKLPSLVLVHGGLHSGGCWDRTVAALAELAPELRTLAVDLPGRASRPADLATVKIADWVNSVVADIDGAGLGDVVVAGHSMAGLILPGVVAKLGARVREMILLAAFIPPQGLAVADTVRGPLVPLARSAPWLPKSFRLPPALARFGFANGMTREQRELMLSGLCAESTNAIFEPVDRSDLPDEVPRTWIMTLRDRALSARQQRNAIKRLGGVDTMFCLDACHEAMFSDPLGLATILAERCRLRASG